MNILIEGPDATGKSTLAAYIAQHTGMSILESEGPPRHRGDITERIERRLAMDNTIFVRHPVVSHPIYDAARSNSNMPSTEIVLPTQRKRFYNSAVLIIYCRPLPHSPHAHLVKPHDSAEHLRIIQHNRDLIDALYRTWAVKHANLIHHIGDDSDRVLGYIIGARETPIEPARTLSKPHVVQPFDPVTDVYAFHVKNNIHYAGKPRALDFELLQFRLKFMREELGEFEAHGDQAWNELDKLTRSPEYAVGDFAFDNANFVHELAAMADALADLVYVALGTAHLMGLPFRTVWERVHAANMLKQSKSTAHTAEERIKLKMIKPPGWEPPRHEDLVEDHAHNKEHKP